MAKNQQQNKASATNAQQVRKQNNQSAQGQNQAGQYGTEFSSETDAQHVKQKNQKSQQNKGQQQQ